MTIKEIGHVELVQLVDWLKSSAQYQADICCSRNTEEKDRLVAVGRREAYLEILSKLIVEGAKK